MGSFSIWHWMVVAIVVIFGVVIPLRYILSFRTTARQVNKYGGDYPVNLSWLMLVPVIGYVWMPVMLIQLRVAIRKTGRAISEDQWWYFGLLFVACDLLAIALGEIAGASLASLLLVGAVVFGIVHWVYLVKVRNAFP